jgi:hypothetical protein
LGSFEAASETSVPGVIRIVVRECVWNFSNRGTGTPRVQDAAGTIFGKSIFIRVALGVCADAAAAANFDQHVYAAANLLTTQHS